MLSFALFAFVVYGTIFEVARFFRFKPNDILFSIKWTYLISGVILFVMEPRICHGVAILVFKMTASMLKRKYPQSEDYIENKERLCSLAVLSLFLGWLSWEFFKIFS